MGGIVEGTVLVAVLNFAAATLLLDNRTPALLGALSGCGSSRSEVDAGPARLAGDDVAAAALAAATAGALVTCAGGISLRDMFEGKGAAVGDLLAAAGLLHA